MIKEVEISVDPQYIESEDYIKTRLIRKIDPSEGKLIHYELLKKSIDARKAVHYKLRYRLYISEKPPEEESHQSDYQMVDEKQAVAIIGAGPAGYFAALHCLKIGLKPVVFDRGVDVRSRRRDLKAIQQDGIVNSESNYCFGEGGAGTYSDGKLYTRSHQTRTRSRRSRNPSGTWGEERYID